MLPNYSPATLHSIQIGAPTNYGFEDAVDPHDKPWTTGFFKTPVEGPIYVGTTNLAAMARPISSITVASTKPF